ncbi:hypothetical protein OG321_35075 [Streptomyces sp. NBC_00424]|uniref:hypothetical protein n=1 Tax=Streptomyces sp. NBC_00424 TaxID=2903648 RepID=UPI00224FAC91|nr:hypothetical protein [Streptomyces sp. NBC_00424]MCX5077703.1 hypothetical protein [Streptomyces sp. NBC_00424]
MIAEFTVRPNQGDPSGFDMGDMRWSGDLGEAVSTGKNPDQGMAIHLSIAHVLDCLRPVLEGRTKNASFVGVDTSFRLVFHSGKKGIMISSPSGPVGRFDPSELAGALLLAAEDFLTESVSTLPPSDAGKQDYLLSLSKFRKIALSL